MKTTVTWKDVQGVHIEIFDGECSLEREGCAFLVRRPTDNIWPEVLLIAWNALWVRANREAVAE